MMETRRLLNAIESCCRAVGADTEIANVVAHHLVRADLSGHPSHGVARLPGYLALVKSGELDAGAHPKLLRQHGSTAVFDARHGFGQYSTHVALDWAIETAQTDGIGFAGVRHSEHIGRVGEYAEHAAQRGTIAIVTVGMAGDGVGAVIAPGTARRFLGANPWTIGIPSSTGDDVIVDVSTAVVAEGKIYVQAARGEQLPEGWAVDRDGVPTTDPTAYIDGGGLLPLGSPTASHKGFGLGLASALIGGLAAVDDAHRTLAGASVADGADPRGRTAGVAIIVMNPSVIAGTPHYAADVAETLAALRRVAPAAITPGEPERVSRQLDASGVDLPVSTMVELRTVAVRLGVDGNVFDV